MSLLTGTKAGVVAGSRTHLEGRGVHQLMPAADGRWWAIADYAEVWRFADGSEELVATLPEGQRLNCVAEDQQGGLWLGASEAGLYRWVDGAVDRVVGFDRAPGRDQWYTPWGGPPDVRSIAVTPAGVFVNVHVGGVVASRDGGDSWEDTMDIHADVHQVIADADGAVWAATARGLAVSRDQAESWAFHREGLHGAYCRAVARGAEQILVSVSLGSGGARAAVYRAPIDAPERLERCQSGLPEFFSTNVNTFCLAARGQMAAVGDEAGTVYVSDDEGSSWDVAATGLGQVRTVAIAD